MAFSMSLCRPRDQIPDAKNRRRPQIQALNVETKKQRVSLQITCVGFGTDQNSFLRMFPVIGGPRRGQN